MTKPVSLDGVLGVEGQLIRDNAELLHNSIRHDLDKGILVNDGE
jgi:hypothetical protein